MFYKNYLPNQASRFNLPQKLFYLLFLLALTACGSGGDNNSTPTSGTLSVLNARVDEGDSGSTSLIFTVNLNRAVADDVTVNYTTGIGTATAGVDYTAVSDLLTITAGNTNATITVSVNGDTSVEQNEIIPVILSNPSSNATLVRSVAHGIINNDDGGISNSLPVTGQQDCFDEAGGSITCSSTGQDGELQKGVAFPSPRFNDNSDGTITDDLTGLIWPDQGNIMPTRDPGYDTEGTTDDGIVTWQTALDYITKLNQESYLGFNDWRLPNRNELRSLEDYGVTNSATELNNNGLSNYARSYWSSSSLVSLDPFAANAWAVNMVSGYAFYFNKTDGNNLHVVPVRGGGNAASTVVLKTGQTQCFDTSGASISCNGSGQDGEYQFGAPWPSSRFTVNVDTTITDGFTGLIWGPNANLMPSRDSGYDTDSTNDDGKVNWQTALDYVAKLNTESYLGFNDWRLPNINEYQSIINIETQMTDFLTSTGWLYTNGFSNIGDLYWTSDTYFAIPAYAWVTHIGASVTATPYAGSAPAADKDTAVYYVWPVRGG